MAFEQSLSEARVADTAATSYVDWCAIIAGAVVASAISLVLFTFGTGIGLSMVSPYEGEGASRSAYFLVFGLWTLWVVVSSFLAGGYIAGRMRMRVGDATEHEVDVRDGTHGLAVWGLGVTVTALFVALGVAGAAMTTARLAGPAVAGATATADRSDFTVDALFRPSGEGLLTTDTEAERNEVRRILTFGTVGGEFNADDRAYVSRLVANRTGLTQAEAEARVDQVMADARRVADDTRKAGVITAFLMAVALLVSAAAAAWAATLGGRHRDENTDTSVFWHWR